MGGSTGKVEVIGCAGLGAAEADELRAMVDQAVPLLGRPWRWGEAAEADLVIVDPVTDAGRLAFDAARGRDARAVALGDAGEPRRDAAVIARPLQFDALLRLLDGADDDAAGSGFTQTYVAPLDATDLSAFFGADLLSAIPDPRARSAQAAPVAVPGQDTVAPGQDTVAPVPAASAAAPVVPAPLPADAPSAPGVGAHGPAAPGVDPPRAAAPMERAAYPLADYLRSALIGLPSRIALPGAPTLVLDPKARCYYAAGELAALEPYFAQRIPRTDWTALLPSMLAAVRAEIAARSFDVLLWYAALRRIDRLAPHLDPGGTYRLKQPLDLSRDHARGAKVATAMATPRALHEIATQSACNVAEVYRIVSAFEAIGYVEWQPRARGPKPSEPAAVGAKPAPRRPGATR